jgi:hypothetical protein
MACLLFGALGVASAYTRANHERSVREGAEKCQSDHGTTIGKAQLKGIVKGVLEPDKSSPAQLQMVKQRFEPGAYGTQRPVSMVRVAAQSIHACPNPTRPAYSDSADDQEKKDLAIPTPAAELLPNRLELEVYSYDTNQDLRNKMLINASQFLCVSLAHRDDAQSARKFGNLLHMIGDTYSASHVQRSEPVGSEDNCGTEKIEWHFSMDLVSWKLHRPADKQYEDWRFRCLVKHASDLMRVWVEGRDAVRNEIDKTAKLERANEIVGTTVRMLCDSILREDPEVLRRPAGGAAAGYSIASGADDWKFMKDQPEDRPIQPVGLTGTAEAEAFHKSVNDSLAGKRSRAHLSYPSRDLGDLCESLAPHDPLPATLQCTSQEIDWAMSGSDEVDTLWIPARTQP